MVSAQPGRRATSALAGTRFARVEWVEETGSTNADLLLRASAGEAEGVVRVAEHQVAGRGTRGRTWIDTPGAQLMVSVLLRPRLAAPRLGRLTMAWAVAAAEACDEVAGAPVRLKWPNDLYDPDGERKVAGVLAESQLAADGAVDAVVIGMGVNCNGGVPAGLAVPGVSLAELTGRPVDRELLLIALLRRFDGLYSRLEEPVVPDAYRRLSATIGRAVRVEQADSARDGVARDVTDDGHLVVEVDGRLLTLAAAEVLHLRNL
jgi:BirA family transcriptional regulator, biotin operon repressor / biotin---[acetyl-CoA-carboxylase] ligase